MALIPDDRPRRELGLAGGHELDAPPWSRVEGTLMSTARVVRRAYDRSFANLDVNLAEASVLAHLGDAGSLTQTELARRIGTGRAHIGVQVDSLQSKGAVERTGDPSDRRVWRVALTPTGRDLWAQTIEVDRRVRHQLRAGISSAERDQLDSLLERIHRNVSELLDGESSSAAPTTARRA